MPVTPDDLVKVLEEIVQEKNSAYEDQCVTVPTITMGVAGAVIGGLAFAGVGAFFGGTIGLGVGGAAGLFYSYFNTKNAADFITAMKKEKKLQLLQHFQSEILLLELDACDVKELREQLTTDKSRTMKTLKIYFDKYLGMNVRKFAAFK